MSAAVLGWLALGLLGLAAGLTVRDVWLHTQAAVRGMRLEQSGRLADAVTVWERYLTTWTLSGEQPRLATRLALAYARYRLGRYDGARDEADQALATATGSLAAMLRRLRDDAQARLNGSPLPTERPPLACDTDPRSFATAQREAERLRADGDWFGALAQLDRLVEDSLSRDFGARHLLQRLRHGLLCLELGYYDLALTRAESLLGRSGLPSALQHDSRRLAAQAQLALGRLDSALIDAQAAFRIANLAFDRERLTDDCHLLGTIQAHRGEFVDAMRNFQRVRECGDRGRWLAPTSEGRLLWRWGRRAEAEQAFGLAARHVRSDLAAGPEGQAAVADSYAQSLWQDEPQRAFAILAPTLDVVPPNPRAALLRDAVAAVVLRAASQPAYQTRLARLAAGQAAFAHDPHAMVAVESAAGLIALLDQQPAEATARLASALEHQTDPLSRPELQVQLGRALEQSGDGERALEQYRAAAGHPQPLEAVIRARARLAELGQGDLAD